MIVYRTRCNGCKVESESASAYIPPDNWHRFDFRDLFGSMLPVDICPKCWPTVTFKTIIDNGSIPEAWTEPSG